MKNPINWFVRRTLLEKCRLYNPVKNIYQIVSGIKIEPFLNKASIIVLALLIKVLLAGTTCCAQERTGKDLYPVMAPLNQYLIGDENSEIALARSSAPPSISDKAEVMVLERTGYTIAVKGTNGFVCIVERSWTKSSDDPDFWNPKVRAPVCYNPQAAITYLPFDLLKTKLVLEGKSKTEIAKEIKSAFDKKELPALEPGAMSYMMSKQQYLGDQPKRWHPHLMFNLPGKVAESWGANLPDSPVIAVYDPEGRVTVFMVWVGKWSDGTPAPYIH